MAVKSMYAVGLDAGSRWTRMVICSLESTHIRFLGAAAVESDGWVKGKIADQQALTDSILRALREAESCAGVSVGSAVVGLGGPTLRGHNARGVKEFGSIREVEQRDVNIVVDRAARRQLAEDRMVLQMYPHDFVVDDHPGHRDPRKMLASRLEINVHLLTGSIQEHSALVGAVNQAHISVEETVFEAMAACYASVLPEYRREGIAVIDIGAHSTELVVYYGDSMQLASVIPLCGDHFTRDLAQGLCIGFEDAELVKLEYGGAKSTEEDNIFVELPTPDGREPRHAQRRFISQILEARANELFGMVRNELARVGMDRALMGGVFLSGGAARLPDLCDVADRVLQCQARFGLAIGVKDWPASLNDPEWACAAGLAMYSAKVKEQAALQSARMGWLGRMLK